MGGWAAGGWVACRLAGWLAGWTRARAQPAPRGRAHTQVEPWLPPTPPIGTHRYVFLLFQQPNQEPVQVGLFQG